MKKLILLLLFIPLVSLGQNTKIKDFKITILSTMFSDTYIGEWNNNENSHTPEQRKKFYIRVTIVSVLFIVGLVVYFEYFN